VDEGFWIFLLQDVKLLLDEGLRDRVLSSVDYPVESFQGVPDWFGITDLDELDLPKIGESYAKRWSKVQAMQEQGCGQRRKLVELI
jgi:hypothetical protein